MTASNHLQDVERDDGGVTSLSVTPLDIFTETSEQFESVFVVTKEDVCDMESGVSCRVCGDQNRYFKPRQDVFPELKQVHFGV